MPSELLAKEMIEYKLFHSSDSFFTGSLRYGRGVTSGDIRNAFEQGKYKLEHTFKYPSKCVTDWLETVFYKSQNLDNGWKDGCRSTSVGDIVQVGDEFWIVASVGFDFGWKV